MPTSRSQTVAETPHAVDGGAGTWHCHAAYGVGAKAQPPSSSQQHHVGIAQKLGVLSSGNCLEPSMLVGADLLKGRVANTGGFNPGETNCWGSSLGSSKPSPFSHLG